MTDQELQEMSIEDRNRYLDEQAEAAREVAIQEAYAELAFEYGYRMEFAS